MPLTDHQGKHIPPSRKYDKFRHVGRMKYGGLGGFKYFVADQGETADMVDMESDLDS